MTRLLWQFVGPWIGRGLINNKKVKELEAVIKYLQESGGRLPDGTRL